MYHLLLVTARNREPFCEVAVEASHGGLYANEVGGFLAIKHQLDIMHT